MSKSFKHDLTGQRFGRLTVLEFVPTEDNKSHWKCKCDCGKIITVCGYNIENENTTSCGCLKKETTSRMFKTHGFSKTRLYRIWTSMKKRCYNLKNSEYDNYGKRGIRMCSSWRDDFQVFYDWAMANGYDDSLTIDRIDVNKGYSSDNCRWADAKTQARNKRNNTMVEYRGETISLAEAAETSGINYGILQHRHFRGDRGERLFRPVKESKNHNK